MINDANKDEMIERYLLGELSGDLLHTFNERLASDEAFKKEVAVERAIVKNLKTAGRNEWAMKLKTLHHELALDETEGSGSDPNITSEEYNRRLGNIAEQVETKMKPAATGKIMPLNKNRHIWMVAASIAIIAICTFSIVFNGGNDGLYRSYYQAYPAPSQFRGETDLSAVEKEAFAAYTQQNYPRSIELSKQILAAQKNESVLFYLGHAYMEAGMYKEAIQTFEQYIQQYQERAVDAKWYLSLSYLKTEQPEYATRYLKEVASTSETDSEAREYATKAKELLDELE